MENDPNQPSETPAEESSAIRRAFPFAPKNPRISRDAAPKLTDAPGTPPPSGVVPQQLSVAMLKQHQEAKAAPSQDDDDMPTIMLAGGTPLPPSPPAAAPANLPSPPGFGPPPPPYQPQQPYGAPPPPSGGIQRDADWLPAPPPQAQSIVPPLAIAAAAVAGTVTCVLWILSSFLMDYQFLIGIWFIGTATGYAAMRAGGRGLMMGLICAGLVIPNLMIGRIIGFYPMVQYHKSQLIADLEKLRDLDGAVKMMPTDNSASAEAAAFFKSSEVGHENIKQFMVDYDKTAAASAAEVTDEETMTFIVENSDYYLQELAAMEDPASIFDEAIAEIEENMSFWRIFWATIGPWDYIFLAFGMLSAFKIGGAKDGDL